MEIQRERTGKVACMAAIGITKSWWSWWVEVIGIDGTETSGLMYEIDQLKYEQMELSDDEKKEINMRNFTTYLYTSIIFESSQVNALQIAMRSYHDSSSQWKTTLTRNSELSLVEKMTMFARQSARSQAVKSWDHVRRDNSICGTARDHDVVCPKVRGQVVRGLATNRYDVSRFAELRDRRGSETIPSSYFPRWTMRNFQHS